ncbi:MAG: hypothetical protein AAFR33_03770 [Pseudomonadota bacterium]
MKPLILGLALASIVGAAQAQSAPNLSEHSYVLSQKLRAARAEATATASASEQRRLSIASQRAQLRLLEAEALAAARPMMRLDTGGPTPMSFSMPAGSGLLPGQPSGDGDTNYHVNIQVGQGNSSAITTTTVSSNEVISNIDEDPDDDVEE